MEPKRGTDVTTVDGTNKGSIVTVIKIEFTVGEAIAGIETDRFGIGIATS